jgi:hypothetical protein
MIIERRYKKTVHRLYLPEKKIIEKLVYQKRKGCFKGHKVKYSKRGAPVITLGNQNYKLVDIIYYRMGYPGYIPIYRDDDKTNLKWSNIRPWEEKVSIEVTKALLMELFEYKEGDLIWKKGSWKGRKTGLKVRIDGKSYLRSHLIWILFKSAKPKRIRHINGDKSDTRIQNLRKWEYHLDHPLAKSVDRVRGVCKRGKKYMAFAYKDGKQRLLGLFGTMREAYESRKLFFIQQFQYWADNYPGENRMSYEKTRKKTYRHEPSTPARKRTYKLEREKTTKFDPDQWKDLFKNQSYREEVLEERGSYRLVRLIPTT